MMKLFKRRSNKINKITSFDVVTIIFLTLVSTVAVIPLIYIVNHAFKPVRELLLYPPTFIVRDPTTRSFRELFLTTRLSIVPFSRYIFNSVVVAALTVTTTLLIASLCAYALAKHDFPGKKMFFTIIIVSMMFTPEAVQITRFIVISKLNIIDTYWGHVLPFVSVPIAVFLLKQFMGQVPDEMIEAARIDGASEMRVFLQIVMAMSLPAVGTVLIITFQRIWVNPNTSILYMNDETMKTLPYFLHSLTHGLENRLARQGAMAAGSLIMFVPNFLIFYMLKRSMIDTLRHSGIK